MPAPTYDAASAFGGVFGDFEIARDADGQACELGRGSMGVTYQAYDLVLDRPVALKVIDARVAGPPEVQASFLREARGAAALRHPNVASIFQYGVREADGQPFYAMELVEGENLWDYVHRVGPLPAPLALEISVQVAKALQAAEARGIIHRDLKPANIMLAVDTHAAQTNALVVKVIDFGLAKAASAVAPAADCQDAQPPRFECFSGTAEFASPEQIAGHLPLDTRADIYALGATLWFLLSCRCPFAGDKPAEIYRQQTTQPPPWELLPGDLVRCQPVAALLGALLSPDPAGRPGNARALLEALENCRSLLTVPAAAGELSRPRRQKRWMVAAGAVALASLALLAHVFYPGLGRLLHPAAATTGRGTLADVAGTHDPDAYDYLLRARAAMNPQNGESPETFDYILHWLGLAVERDPNFSVAYTDIAYWQATYFCRYDPTPARAALAAAALERALQLRPDDAETHDAAGIYQYYVRRDYERARQEYTTALKINPRDGTAIFRLGLVCRRQGHWDQALDYFQRAEILTPLRGDCGSKIVETLVGLHRYGEVSAVGERWKAKDPRDTVLQLDVLAAGSEGSGRLDGLREAVALYAKGAEVDDVGITLRLRLALRERDPVAAARVVAAASAKMFTSKIPGEFHCLALFQADAAALTDTVAAVRPALEEARVPLAEAWQARPDDVVSGMALARIDAYLGRREDALREGRQAYELRRPSVDGFEGPRLGRDYAAVLALLGERGPAIDLLYELGHYPGSPAYNDLLFTPDWDNLRGEPRFEALVRSLAPRP